MSDPSATADGTDSLGLFANDGLLPLRVFATCYTFFQAMSSTASNKIEVYTDGDCPLCQWMRSKVEPFDRDGRVVWLNYRDPQVLERAAPHTFAEMNDEMHARNSNGQWSRGYAAWIDVLRVLRLWRWIAPVLAIWPFTVLGPVVYKWLARRRYSLFGIPPPCDDSGVCSLHSHN